MFARTLLHQQEIPDYLGGFTISVYRISLTHAKHGRIYLPGSVVLRITRGDFVYEL